MAAKLPFFVPNINTMGVNVFGVRGGTALFPLVFGTVGLLRG